VHISKDEGHLNQIQELVSAFQDLNHCRLPSNIRMKSED
jgi:hypothetical protein